jgi:hypothetical protein|tara:strand:- start:761 stop:1177 length:417 start_codon:yes stop_codon:yes gene_type:complete
MSETENKKDEHLLINIITMFTQQAWMAMGKLKNPVTDKTERNLQEASFYIDIIDLMRRKMSGNLSDDEEKFLDSSLSGLKMNYLEESNKPESNSDSKDESSSETNNSEDDKPIEKVQDSDNEAENSNTNDQSKIDKPE